MSAVLQPSARTVAAVVRMIPVEVNGKVVWTEDAPDVCPNGHTALLHRWDPCTRCGWACRHWRCQVCAATLIDDEHRCRGGNTPG